MTQSHRRRPSPLVLVVLLSALVALGAVLVVFQPQKLFYDKTVNEALPAGAPLVVPSASTPATAPVPVPTSAAPAPTSAAPVPTSVAPTRSAVATAPAPTTAAASSKTKLAGPTVLGTGAFTSREHHTTGAATVLRLVDGTRVLRLERLDTSNGPDLHVYLTKANADAQGSAFGKNYVSLGTLKGNKGNQNYAIPAGLDLTGYQSVVIWCKRFSVAFGVAPLHH